jgi:hypothetical protein
MISGAATESSFEAVVGNGTDSARRGVVSSRLSSSVGRTSSWPPVSSFRTPAGGKFNYGRTAFLRNQRLGGVREGTEKKNSEPLAPSECNHKSPPCCTIMRLAVARPRPTPPAGDGSTC